jgi:RNA polymerase sigma factor (sigma-70 family)
MTHSPLAKVVRHIRRSVAAGRPVQTDAQLLACFAAQRDEAAFAELVERHGPMVLGVCRRTLRCRHAAEDAFQATFLILARKAGTVHWSDSIAAWLYAVAQRVALKARTAAARRGVRETELREVSDPSCPDESGWEELWPVVDEELGRLPEKCRMPLILCYLEGKTNEQAARELGWPIGTVWYELSRGRELLRARLARRGLAPTAPALAVLLQPDTGAAGPLSPLAESTLQKALLFTTGAVAGTPAAALAEGVLRTMGTNRWMMATIVLLTVTTLGLGTVTLTQGRSPQAPPILKPIARAEDKPAPAVLVAAADKDAPATQVGLPPDWFGGSRNTEGYEVGIDRKVFKEGKVAAYVQMKNSRAGEFGTLGQQFLAKAYLGKRVRLSAQLKTQDVKTNTGLWMRVDCKGKTLAFDNMPDRRLSGTTDWTRAEIVLDVSDKATVITIGMLLVGDGKVWMDDVKVEVVGKDVKPTAEAAEFDNEDVGDVDGVREKPTNLGFENEKK